MKTTKTISMAEFAKEVEKIATTENKTYYTVKCEIGKFLNKDGTTADTIEFTAYISGHSHFTGKTPNECLQLIKAKIYPKKSVIQEVLV